MGNYFQNLFSDDLAFGIPPDWPNLFPTIDSSIITQLNSVVFIEEIRMALFSIGGLKASGLDRIPMILFQKFWETCRKDITKLVPHCFETATIPKEINKTLIVLIPNVPNPTTMNHLRPISLCNIVYKIISKVLVNRIRPLLSPLINPAQSSFVLGRQISDNIIIVQEAFNKFSNYKSKKRYMAWKVDLSKAYDHLNWKFISDVLKEIGVGNRILGLQQCISTVNYNPIINGEMYGNIIPK